jgi:deoxyribodipyrimidine photolyase-related protein
MAMGNNKTLRLILGDQLNRQHHWFSKVDEQVHYVFMECRSETDYVVHHIQKIVGFFLAMRNFTEELRSKGHQVTYIHLDDADNQHSIAANLEHLLDKHRFSSLEYQLPDEYRLDVELKALSARLPVPVVVADTEHFYTSRSDLRHWLGERNHYVMETFYRKIRTKYSVLMDGKNPMGGKWNFDSLNRNKYDNKIPLPSPLLFRHNVSSLCEMIDKMGVKYIGTIKADDFNWPVNRSEALQLLDYFVDDLLPCFGTYQDAMLIQHRTMFHSRLSFALNTKMISPVEVVNRAAEAYHQKPERYLIAQVEGFIRQIIGWREYMRGIYWTRMPAYEQENYFQHQRPLPAFYWTAHTRMNCMKHAIRQSLDDAYAHHIQRLMVTGNFALLAGIHPDEVDAWYLGIYMDALQWVEITNTRGMSQFADGGVVATKPYVSSAAYINKMSDYCKTCYYKAAEKTGDKACPFNSLYWHFIFRNEDKLKSNQRMSMMYATWNKMKPNDREALIQQAEKYLKSLDDL